jgi:PAS domain S-box-containing protein
MVTQRSTTILLVARDAAERLWLRQVLGAEGFAIQEATSGAEGLRLAAANPPDLMLLEGQLAKGAAIDIGRHLKADPRTAPILVLYLTAQRDPGHRNGLDAGADGYVSKPVDPPVLLAHIHALLRLRQAETASRNAAQQWRTTFDAVHDAICLLDSGGNVLRCNRAMANLLHRPFADIVGRSYGELLRGVADPAALPHFTRVQETRQRETTEVAISDRWYRVSADPVSDEHGAVIGTVHLFADLTERKHTEQALAQFAAIVESSDDAMISTLSDGRVVSWNPAAVRLFGYAAEEIQGQSVALLLPPERADKFARPPEALQPGKRIQFWETVGRRKDGRLLDVVVTASPMQDAAGTVTGASIIIRDITQRKRLEDQLRQAQKMEAIGHLAGGVAHDFNNLLTVILGYSQLVQTQMPPHAPLAGALEGILKAGDRAAALTRQLLAFSRRQILEPKVLDLNALVADMEKMLGRLIGEDIDLAIRLDPTLDHVRVDPGQLDQVLLNLALNARDAMPQGGQLTIETSNVELDETYAQITPEVRPGPYVLLAMSDTGIGIPRQDLPHIFEPFFTTKQAGTGLGLATVYGIVRQSNGHLAVYSERGHGTTFKIYLPRITEPIAPASPPSPALHGQGTILVVEDEEAVRQFACQALQQYGFTVLEASRGADALHLAQQHTEPIHLLLTDVVMPQMNGRELAYQLTALHPETKVLYVSGYPADAVVHHGILEAETPFLHKPFSKDTLARKIWAILQQTPIAN